MKNSRIVLLGIVITLIGGCSGKAVKSTETQVPWVGQFKVHRYSLDNGLRLLVVEDHSSPTFAYHTWFRVGSRDESPGRTGLAHLFEHMMFKGTSSHKEGEFDKMLEAAGAEGENAFTSRDYTAYVQELPSDKFELIAGLEADRMVKLVVNDESFKTEREVVQNERKFRTENSPDGVLYQEIFDAAFTKHSYHWPVIGYEKDLAGMKAEDASAFYRQYYSPNHATIVVVGDVEPARVYDIVQRKYGSLAAQNPPTTPIDVEPPQTEPRRKRLKLNIQVEKMLMGYHIPGVLHEDMAALDVMQGILTGGKSSRLSRALVNTGIASAVDCYDIEDKDPSLFIFLANMQKGRSATQAEAIILREIARLSREKPSAAEVERAKNRIQFSFYEGANSNSSKARFLGHYEAVAGDFTLGLKHYEQVPKVTAEDVQRVARQYLNPNGRTVITGVSK